MNFGKSHRESAEKTNPIKSFPQKNNWGPKGSRNKIKSSKGLLLLSII